MPQSVTIAMMWISTLIASVGQCQTFTLPDATEKVGQVILGQAQGRVAIHDSQVHLDMTAKSLADYPVNMTKQAAVMDFYLPDAIALPAACNRLALSYRYQQQAQAAELRLLIRGADGRVRAWATKFAGRSSQLDFTDQFSYVETFAWDASEAGRFDAWVMTGLNPSEDVSYQPPTAPLSLVGFRLAVMKTDQPVAIALQNIRPLSSGVSDQQTYWTIDFDRIWNERVTHKSDPRVPMRYGLSPDHPQPYLLARDMKLASGQYACTWEILDQTGWQVIASGSKELTLDNADAALKLPLLPVGTYPLRIYLRKSNQARGTQLFYLCTVIRNPQTQSTCDKTTEKPLVITRRESGQSNLFDPGQPVNLNLQCNLPTGELNARIITWTVTGPDGSTVDQGQCPADKPAALELAHALQRHKALWIEVTCRNGQTVEDIAYRVIGLRSPALTPRPAKASDRPNAKLDVLKGQIRRTLGDWFEGSVPILSDYQHQMSNFTGWMQQARDDGYNIVELPATWYDLEPLPDVYLFEYLDAYVDKARELGLRVMLRVHPQPSTVPDWVPRQYQQDQNGMAHGLWGGGNNEVFSPGSKALLKPYHAYLLHLASHYRDDPTVLGYTISNLYFDHCYFTSPWLGQYVDYSPVMHGYFIDFLKHKYHDDLAAVRRLHQTDYASWQAIAIPLPKVRTDALGRLMPRTDGLWLDWVDAKVAALTGPYRIQAIEAIRQGDPACAVGPYSDQARSFLEQFYAAHQIFVPQGSMEDQFPPPPYAYPVRYEPIAKVTRTATMADVGMTNMLFYKPGFNGFFQYWMSDWRLDTIKPSERDAELRLKQWFAVADCLVGAQPVKPVARGRSGLEIDSMQTLMLNWQHFHIARINDYVNPFRYRVQRDKIHVQAIYSLAMSDEKLAEHPYVYLPYSSDTLTKQQIEQLVNYVKEGHRLVLEADSGFWCVGQTTPNVLGGLLGLPLADPTGELSTQAVSEKAQPVTSLLQATSLAFRIQPFHQPIESQSVPWLHTANQAYFRTYRLSGKLPQEAEVHARFADGSPACYSVAIGKGQVLVFVGTVDWIDCPGLARMVERWACGSQRDDAPAENPDLLVTVYRKDSMYFVLGRRFASSAYMAGMDRMRANDPRAQPVPMAVRFESLPAGDYQITERVSGLDLGCHASTTLRQIGVVLNLRPGEGFLLQAKPCH